MAIQSSGYISLQNIEDEFGGTGSISLSEYYRNGSYVTSNNTSVPNSGNPISMSNFYGAVRQFSFSITSNTQNANIRTLAVAAGWDGSAPLITTVNSGVWLWSDSTSLGGAIISGSFPGGLTLLNYGKIIGKGGAGAINGAAGSPGGPALTVASTGVAVTNNSGAYIAGGGGGGGAGNRHGRQPGGGGGAGGGAGGASDGSSYAGGSGGAIGASSSVGSGWFPSGSAPAATAGGTGGLCDESSSGSEYGTGASGGGRVLPGVQVTIVNGRQGLLVSGRGGYGGLAGENGVQQGNGHRGGGGGGWGAAGGTAVYGAGGAGGAAISGTSVSLTNNGTIYGST